MCYTAFLGNFESRIYKQWLLYSCLLNNIHFSSIGLDEMLAYTLTGQQTVESWSSQPALQKST